MAGDEEFSGELLLKLKKPRLGDDEESKLNDDEESKLKRESETEDENAYNSDNSDFYAADPDGYHDFYAADPDGYHEMNPEECRIYAEAVNKSRGFDVPAFPKVLEIGLITPVCLSSDGDWYDEIELCAEFALEEHNKEAGKKYQLHKLVKANMAPCAGSIYYITFVAEDLTQVGESGKSVVPEDICGVGGGESEKLGPSGGLLVEFQAETYMHLPDKDDNCKIEVFYFGAKESQ